MTFCLWDKLGSDNFVRDELGSDILSGTNWGVSLGQTWIWWDKGGSYKIDVDSRVPCWARGVIRVPCRGRGTIRVGGGEVVDVWQEQEKL